MTKEIVLIGSGGHASSIIDAATSQKLKIKALIDIKDCDNSILGIKVYKSISEIPEYQKYEYVVAIGDNSLRKTIVAKSIAEFPEIKFATIIHNTAYISESALISEGTVILGQSFIGPRCRVDKHCIINTGSKIDHDCFLDVYSSTGPGTLLGGNVNIGKGSIVSIGATVRHSLSIGNYSLLGGGSYLNEDIGENMVFYGVPAKFIRNRSHDEKYL